ncbi:hypothetical protein FQN49_005766 [Arthroderma sp. PD_2]|nr:hypothetical protein FQN49_005766 [Arthroderma sp. PD_2]
MESDRATELPDASSQHPTSTFPDWSHIQATAPANSLQPDSTDGRTFKRRRLSSSVAPITLSFIDDEASASSPHSIDIPPPAEPDHDETESPSKPRKRSSPTSAPQYEASTATHDQLSAFAPPAIMGADSAEVLYEYFPLALDEWQAPVDAVYRPHVVHHTGFDDAKAMAARRSKRYFAEEAS